MDVLAAVQLGRSLSPRRAPPARTAVHCGETPRTTACGWTLPAARPSARSASPSRSRPGSEPRSPTRSTNEETVWCAAIVRRAHVAPSTTAAPTPQVVSCPADAATPEVCTPSAIGSTPADEDGDGAVDEGCPWHFGTPHWMPPIRRRAGGTPHGRAELGQPGRPPPVPRLDRGRLVAGDSCRAAPRAARRSIPAPS